MREKRHEHVPVILLAHPDPPGLLPVLLHLRWAPGLVLQAGADVLQDDPRVVAVVLLFNITEKVLN